MSGNRSPWITPLGRPSKRPLRDSLSDFSIVRKSVHSPLSSAIENISSKSLCPIEKSLPMMSGGVTPCSLACVLPRERREEGAGSIHCPSTKGRMVHARPSLIFIRPPSSKAMGDGVGIPLPDR